MGLAADVGTLQRLPKVGQIIVDCHQHQRLVRVNNSTSTKNIAMMVNFNQGWSNGRVNNSKSKDI